MYRPVHPGRAARPGIPETAWPPFKAFKAFKDCAEILTEIPARSKICSLRSQQRVKIFQLDRQLVFAMVTARVTASANHLHLVPLGAGDLIDRAVRLYRRHLFVLIRIAAPPVFLTAIGSVLWTIAVRGFFATPSDAAFLLYIFMVLAAIALFLGGHIFSLLVMGGASRNLVTHLLWNEPVLVRTTYAAVRSRFWSLLVASVLMMLWLGVGGAVAFVGWYMVVVFVGLGAIVLAQWTAVWFGVLAGVVGGLAATAAALWLFFLMAGRVAYIPQVMLVEGKSVGDAINRSFALAKGNVRRLMAMTLFVTFATYSALMILVIPLALLAWLNGVTLSPISTNEIPVLYSILYSILGPLSAILLAPVWMLGFSLLYVDERVRHEGYDIELMASQKLGPMPQLDISSPLGTAISAAPGRALPPPPLSAYGKPLGLS